MIQTRLFPTCDVMVFRLFFYLTLQGAPGDLQIFTEQMVSDLTNYVILHVNTVGLHHQKFSLVSSFHMIFFPNHNRHFRCKCKTDLSCHNCKRSLKEQTGMLSQAGENLFSYCLCCISRCRRSSFQQWWTGSLRSPEQLSWWTKTAAWSPLWSITSDATSRTLRDIMSKLTKGKGDGRRQTHNTDVHVWTRNTGQNLKIKELSDSFFFIRCNLVS